MDEPFLRLEHLSLSSAADEDMGLVLPETFLAPNLRQLSLHGIGLPKTLPLLSSTFSLAKLTLTDIRSSGYFLPKQLVTHLRSCPHLEELNIGFSIPIPRPSTERELLGPREIPVILSNLKCFTFHGVSVYLESLVAQLRAPNLWELNITLFNQIVF